MRYHDSNHNKVDLNNNTQNWHDHNLSYVLELLQKDHKDSNNNWQKTNKLLHNGQNHDKTKEDIAQIEILSLDFQKSCMTDRVSNSVLEVPSKQGREIPTNINLLLLFQNKKKRKKWIKESQIFWKSINHTHPPLLLSNLMKTQKQKRKEKKKRKEEKKKRIWTRTTIKESSWPTITFVCCFFHPSIFWGFVQR